MSFRFKQFAVQDSECGMKVGTDGVLLGAWAALGCKAPCRVLDIGSGSGLISLMLAQRFATATVTGIDIDQSAIEQSRVNFADSPFADRLHAHCISLQAYGTEARTTFDLIVSNPPFFQESLHCPDAKRTLARHTSTLSYEELTAYAARLLAPDGSLELILPASEENKIVCSAEQQNFYLQRICRVRGRINKPHKRILLAFSRRRTGTPMESELVLETLDGKRTRAYQELAKDFYLDLKTGQ